MVKGVPAEASPRWIEAALAVALRHDTIVSPDAFSELLEVLKSAFPFSHAGITVTDMPGTFRILVVSREGATPVVPFHVRIPSSPEIYDSVYIKKQPFAHTSFAPGSPLQMVADQYQLKSYMLFPLSQGEGPTVGGFALAFKSTEDFEALPVADVARLVASLTPSVARGVEVMRDRRAARILDATGDALLAWDADGTIVDVNTAAEALTCKDRDALIGVSIRDLLGEIPRAPSTGRRFRLRRPSDLLTVASTVSHVHGDPLVVAHVLLRDLSEVVNAEHEASMHLAQLHELTEQRMLLLENLPLVIFRLEPQTFELTYLNRHAERLFGVSADEALAEPAFLRTLHIDPEGTAAFDDAVRRAAQGGVAPAYEARLGTNDETSIMVRGTVYPVLTEGDNLVGIEGVLLDITGEHAARSRLLQADRLATVGMLAAGVAHEINNPAAFMLLGVDALKRQLAHPDVEMPSDLRETTRQLVEDLREAGRRVVDIARDMRHFASSSDARSGPVDVARTIDSALTITRSQILEKADLIVEVPNDLPPVAIEDGRLVQVLVNLIVNGAHAIASARASRGTSLGPDRLVIAACREGDEVVITVEDTGCGISPAMLPRVFTPFYTTKAADAGTGLGLSLSHAIVTEAGGTIRVSSPGSLGEPPSGTRFEVRLPFIGDFFESPAPPSSEAAPLGPRLSVLIVEDEALLGRALLSQLSEYHEVSLASGAEEALEALRRRRFDAILCDWKMPGTGGEALYREVEREDVSTAARFIVMTGVGFATDIASFIEEVGLPILEKPFPIHRALHMIQAASLRGQPSDST